MTNAPNQLYLLRCQSRRHRVAIDPTRFWQPAYCPVCRTPVDSRGIRRRWMWFVGRAPRSRLRVGKLGAFSLLEAGSFVVVGVVAAVALTLWTLGDRWWAATALLFAGRWPWLAATVPVALVCLASLRPRPAILGIAGVLIALYPVMGFTAGLGRWVGGGDPGSRIRVVTFNSGGRVASKAGILDLVDQFHPDIIAFQECGAAVPAAAEELPDFHIHRSSICLLSRFPIDTAEIQPRRDLEVVGGSGQVVRYRIRGPAGPFSLINVHLETPRDGLESLLGRNAGARALIDNEIILRNIESSRARQWADSTPAPRLVMGDFNTPKESVIFQRHWGDLTEAFDRAGFGFGHSKFTKYFGLRIDHILADKNWVVKAARILPDFGSDHRPMMADVELRR